MILIFMAALVLGAAGGGGVDELLRGRDPRSIRVIIGGVVGAFAGLTLHRWAAVDGGVLLDALWMFVGATALACATRMRISAAIVHPF
jgi:hypothetical protein